jgi:hypothetical protein
MKKTLRTAKAPTQEALARKADSGKSVSRFFTNSGKMIKPGQRVSSKSVQA